MSKLKCPNCGSENLVFYRENLSVYITKLTKDGKLPRREHLSHTDGNFPHHIDCKDCMLMFDYDTDKNGKITKLYELSIEN